MLLIAACLAGPAVKAQMASSSPAMTKEQVAAFRKKEVVVSKTPAAEQKTRTMPDSKTGGVTVSQSPATVAKLIAADQQTVNATAVLTSEASPAVPAATKPASTSSPDQQAAETKKSKSKN